MRTGMIARINVIRLGNRWSWVAFPRKYEKTNEGMHPTSKQVKMKIPFFIGRLVTWGIAKKVIAPRIKHMP
jgi:hypothetical protein